MSLHLLMVLYAGLVYLSAGAALLEITRLLGKSFKTKVSARWWVQGIVFVGAVIMFGYGAMLLFPGQAVQVQHMSLGLPLVGTVALCLALWVLEYVTGEREPPPWSVDIIRLAALLGWGGVMKAMSNTDPALYGDALPHDGGGRRLIRLAVILGAIVLIVAVAGTILIDSARPT